MQPVWSRGRVCTAVEMQAGSMEAQSNIVIGRNTGSRSVKYLGDTMID
jgi:hypothetical protein